MRLILDNFVITTPIQDILEKIKYESGNKYFSRIISRGSYLSTCCPWHSDGQEKHPSFSVFIDEADPNLTVGTCHCFTCGQKSNLIGLVKFCLGLSYDDAKNWLISNFSDTLVEEINFLPAIILDSSSNIIKTDFLDESILDKYNFYHPYMDKRKITPEVRQLFKIGYDKETKMITFPVWDDRGNLLFISKRSVEGKRFELAAGKDKPVYGLNFIKQKGITSVYLAESQINVLTLWSWGYPAIGLFGTGSKTQYEILKNSGIRSYCLCFDGDLAGDHGKLRFIENMPSDILISSKQMPRGKDVNDLTKEEFDKLILN